MWTEERAESSHVPHRPKQPSLLCLLTTSQKKTRKKIPLHNIYIFRITQDTPFTPHKTVSTPVWRKTKQKQKRFFKKNSSFLFFLTNKNDLIGCSGAIINEWSVQLGKEQREQTKK